MSETLTQAPAPAAERLAALVERTEALETTLTQARAALDAAESAHRAFLESQMVDGIPYPADKRDAAVLSIRALKAKIDETIAELAVADGAVRALERAVAVEAFESANAKARELCESSRADAEAAVSLANDFLAAFARLAAAKHRHAGFVEQCLRLQSRHAIDERIEAGRFPIDLERLAAAIEAALAPRHRHRMVSGPAPKISAD